MIDYRPMLEAASEQRYAEFSGSLMPGKERVLGVRIPELRRIAKLIVKDDWRSFLEESPVSFEEEVLKGLVIATAKMDVEERISLTDGFLPYIDNWATCDIFCSSWKYSRKEADRAWDYFSGLIDTDDEFGMRVSVVMRMSHFIDDDHVDLLLEDIATHDNPGYYYRMGAAWAVSVCFVKYPGKTRELLESDRLEVWTHNKSIQKIRESLRVPAEVKEELKELRRRVP